MEPLCHPASHSSRFGLLRRQSPAQSPQRAPDQVVSIEKARSSKQPGLQAFRRGQSWSRKEFKITYPQPVANRKEADAAVASVIALLGKANILGASPSYRQGDWFDSVRTAVAAQLEVSCKSANTWSEALDEYEGVHSTPLMTIHKSKGLEYHTVILVGLDDVAWWSFANDKSEATAGFFVAFSRAKQRVVFSYCAARGTHSKIADLYALLTKAGVKTIKVA
jgi:hypothetical protein